MITNYRTHFFISITVGDSHYKKVTIYHQTPVDPGRRPPPSVKIYGDFVVDGKEIFLFWWPSTTTNWVTW
jgi:hypothetical protein